MLTPMHDLKRSGGQQSRNGFTLVELLVVIGIIALLISILLPALSRAREAAKLVQCQSNLRQIGQAIIMYTGDYHGSLPEGFWDGLIVPGTGTTITYTAPDSAGNHATFWSILIQPYMGKAGSTWNDNATTGGATSAVRAVFTCPSAPIDWTLTSGNTITHYICHPRLMPAMQGWIGPDGLTGQWATPYKISHIKRNSEIGMVFEAALYNDVAGKTGWNVPDTVPVGFRLDAGAIQPRTQDPSTFLTDDYYGPTYKGTTHNTGANPLNAGQPISLACAPFAPYNTAAVMNTDTPLNSGEIGPATGGSGNIRFRHTADTQTNVLMVDGHVQTFSYNPRSQVTDLLRGNINVNP